MDGARAAEAVVRAAAVHDARRGARRAALAGRAWSSCAIRRIITFEDAGGGKTKYTATVRHWSVADRVAHEKMGFHEGWGICADQLGAVAAKL